MKPTKRRKKIAFIEKSLLIIILFLFFLLPSAFAYELQKGESINITINTVPVTIELEEWGYLSSVGNAYTIGDEYSHNLIIGRFKLVSGSFIDRFMDINDTIGTNLSIDWNNHPDVYFRVTHLNNNKVNFIVEPLSTSFNPFIFVGWVLFFIFAICIFIIHQEGGFKKNVKQDPTVPPLRDKKQRKD